MTITRLFLFNRVHDLTPARPGNRELFVQEVINVLFQEKSVFFQDRGQLLSPDFKSNPAVLTLAQTFHTEVKKIWKACREKVADVRQKSYFNKFVDFSKVDFPSMFCSVQGVSTNFRWKAFSTFLTF